MWFTISQENDTESMRFSDGVLRCRCKFSNLSAVRFLYRYVIYNWRRDFKLLAQNFQNRLHLWAKDSMKVLNKSWF